MTICLLSFILLGVIKNYSTPVSAIEEPLILTVELNDVQVANTIKQQMIEHLASTEIYAEALDKINLNASELDVDGLDISQLGEQDVLLRISLETSALDTQTLVNKTISQQVQVQVVDTTAPELTLKYSEIRLNVEEELVPLDWISEIRDNSNLTLEDVQVDLSQLDINQPGEYVVTYSLSDESLNTTSIELAVEVKHEPTYNHYGTDASLISDLLEKINNMRGEIGLHALELAEPNAQSAIGVRACEAATNVSHTRPDGRHYKTAFDDYGVSYSAPYEVLTYAGSTTQDKLDWWMGSPGHRAHLQRSQSTQIAIGYCGEMWAAIVYN